MGNMLSGGCCSACAAGGAGGAGGGDGSAEGGAGSHGRGGKCPDGTEGYEKFISLGPEHCSSRSLRKWEKAILSGHKKHAVESRKWDNGLLEHWKKPSESSEEKSNLDESKFTKTKKESDDDIVKFHESPNHHRRKSTKQASKKSERTFHPRFKSKGHHHVHAEVDEDDVKKSNLVKPSATDILKRTKMSHKTIEEIED